MVRSVTFLVRGNPAVLTAPRRLAEPWKRAVAAAAGDGWSSGYVVEPCAVEPAARTGPYVGQYCPT